MADFQCVHCPHTHRHQWSLTRHARKKHPGVAVGSNARGAGKSTGASHHCTAKSIFRSDVIWISMCGVHIPQFHNMLAPYAERPARIPSTSKCTRERALELLLLLLLPPPEVERRRVPPLIGVDLHSQYEEDGEPLGVPWKPILWT